MIVSLLTIATLAAGSSDFIVSNFASGLACMRTTPVEDRTGWICQPTEVVLITDQGDCVYNHEKKFCTWFGFEFDYQAKEKGIKLQCNSKSSAPFDNGNPEGLIEKSATGESYEIVLPDTKGHYFHPQYFIFGVEEPTEADLVKETICTHSGEEVLRFTFRVHFPSLPSIKGNGGH